MKSLSNTEAEFKKSVAYKKTACTQKVGQGFYGGNNLWSQNWYNNIFFKNQWWSDRVSLKPLTIDSPTHWSLATYPPGTYPMNHWLTIINLHQNRRSDSEVDFSLWILRVASYELRITIYCTSYELIFTYKLRVSICCYELHTIHKLLIIEWTTSLF